MNKSKIGSFPLRTEAKKLILCLNSRWGRWLIFRGHVVPQKTPKNLQYWNHIQHGRMSCYGRNVGPELLRRESLTHLLDMGEMLA